MSVLSVNLIRDSQRGRRQKGKKRSYSAVYAVQTDDALDGPVTVRTAAGIPQIGSTYAVGNEADPAAKCVSIDPARVGDSNLWHVSIEWTETEENEQDNPLDRPAVYDYGRQDLSKLCDVDIDDEAILNSAGYAFDPPLEMDDSRIVITITKNVEVFQESWLTAWKDRVNTATWRSFAAGTAKIKGITGTGPHVENGQTYFVATAVIEINADGWLKEPLDQGRYNGDDEPIEDGYGEVVQDPVPLDGAGMPLANPTPATAVFLSFTVYQTADFATLPVQ